MNRFFAACAIAASLTGCASSADSAGAASTTGERRLVVADANGPVQLQPGEVVVLDLEANPSTGYGWIVDTTAAAGVIEQMGEPSMALSNPGAVGGGGTQTWRFRAAAKGRGVLRLDYRRAWEKDVAPVRSVSWNIEVR
ncbi:protease inhibitor I42 family protein [Lysobacter silvisoli]|nr:protease inhibitor I42 family protein [Lysobacter silvisoli]